MRRRHVIPLLNTLLVAWWTGAWIAMDFWVSWLMGLAICGMTILPGAISIATGMSLSNLGVRPGRAFLIAFFSLITGASLAWGWIRLDDWNFSHEASSLESGFSRPRWFPYQSIDLEQDEAGDPIVYE